VDEDGNQDFFAKVIEDEIKETIHSFQKDKIPGSDRWNIKFYLDLFDLIQVDLLQIVEDSRRNGRLDSPINSTLVTLIPKRDEPQSFDDFRPISLCNLLYKFIAKIIARILNPILSVTISKGQFGFLKCRQIHEVIGLAQKGLHSQKTSKSRGTILEIDLSKAFDRIHLSYIIILLTHPGFEVPFIKCIMACLNLVSFTILINNVASPFFHLEHGLRQGCPLSPLLFLLVVEILS
jgi:hypothetical protein